VVRSSGLSSPSRPASSGTVGCPWLEATLTVECTTGTPKVLIVLTVVTAFLTTSPESIERIVASCAGW
jgi:hypothetical protein